MPHTIKRISIQVFCSFGFSAPVIYALMALYGYLVCQDSPAHDRLMIDSLIIAIMLVAIIMSIEIGIYFFTSWKKSLVDVEKYKTETAYAQLQNLKNQINPHFLFNNMSVLSSLVYKDQDKAVDFINQLSQVYRYLLDQRNNELVNLQEEIEFVKAYIYLLQIRFDDNINFTINISQDELNKKIPPMSLQVLVENTVKHNEVSKAHPLHVTIATAGNYISVRNNLQLRQTPVESAKLGLQNIKDRYAYLSDLPISISNADNLFTVSLPLLNV
jgi:two-component system, LytTR family, sensor kinase